MKRLSLILALILVFITISCSDTTVVKNLPDNGSSAPPISGYFKQNVLLEDYTGTWCGNCTRIPYAVEKFKEVSDNIVEIAIHNLSNDPYKLDNTLFFKQLVQLVSPGSNSLGLPKANLNRTKTLTAFEYLNLNEALSLTGNNCGLGLAMNSTVANGNINIDVNAKFAQNYSNLRLVVVVLENNLIHNQVNYNSFIENGEHDIPNYVHNHVLRAPLTDILGDTITGTTTGQTVTKSFSAPIPANVSNASNISFVAMIVDENNTVINSRAFGANENQTFEQNP
jgi:hypothetical protein